MTIYFFRILAKNGHGKILLFISFRDKVSIFTHVREIFWFGMHAYGAWHQSRDFGLDPSEIG